VAELGSLGSANLPGKSNFQKQSGFDALTGKSNFDISEWMLMRVMEWLDGRDGAMAMLCKTAVARKLLSHAWRNGLDLSAATLHAIDATECFGAAVDACLLTCRFGPGVHAKTANVYSSLESDHPASTLGWRIGQVITNTDAFDEWRHLAADGRQPDYTWRSGVKHDCSRVMELYEVGGRLYNKLDEAVEIEPTFVFPMMKSSEVAKSRATGNSRMLVTQTSLKSETDNLESLAPKTWKYLSSHAAPLDARRSSIYRNRPRFCVFGVGNYTFAPYKVAISGFYKRFGFELVAPHDGRAGVFEDAV
jgi:hypothetical protein